ncbi:MBL fold metallo-hydrolase [Nocardia lijiangensis]|uniref:MBL fold metallo-hydrolase n=1 Tax=Nocardia lijiangensis TaxID=299618 RepID=UPI00082D2F65|nr:MBL fold metallo-hydrolase [Nocardia lijiangensis]
MTLSLGRSTRPATVHRHQLGDHRITYLPDGVALLEPAAWLPDSDEQVWAQHANLINPDGFLVASVGALLVEHGERAMLIDAGFGPLAVPTNVGLLRGGQLLDSLAAVGKTPADIDLIAVTHLHMDHIGWLWAHPPGHTRPPFADTPVVVGRTEWEHPELAAADGTPGEVLDIFAHQVRTIGSGEEIFPSVTTMATPGHSLGHTSYLIESVGQRLIAFGDALTTPVQITHPHLTTVTDDEPALARATAMRLINELSRSDTVGFGVHFADIQLGRVTTHAGGQCAWQPE